MPLNGDELRRLALPPGLDRHGYIASGVDELLLRIADEMDAGRPVASLVDNATLRTPETVTLRKDLYSSETLRQSTYYPPAVDWLLGQLRRRDDGVDRARLENDPWHNLTPWDFSEHHADAWLARKAGADPDTDAWQACGELPGTRLRWLGAGVWRRELRAEGGQVSASVRRRVDWMDGTREGVVRVGGRAFTVQRVSRAAWPETAATFGAVIPAAGSGSDHLFVKVLADPFGLPVMCTGYGGIRLPGGRWFQFAMRGWHRKNGVMTALDQDGNKVALYRMPGAEGGFSGRRRVEIAVHPGQAITDELLLILAMSAPYLSNHFRPPDGGAGGG